MHLYISNYQGLNHDNVFKGLHEQFSMAKKTTKKSELKKGLKEKAKKEKQVTLPPIEIQGKCASLSVQKIEFPVHERKEQTTKEMPKPKPEDDKNVAATLNMLYGIVALLIVFGVLFFLLFFNIGKDGAGTNKNFTTYNGSSNSSLGTINISVGSLPVLGSESALITMIEFSDYQCPYCGEGYKTEKKIEQDYVTTGKVKMYFRDLPLTSMHDKAMSMAIAARCANEQGKFWEMHDKIFDNQGAWSSLPTATAMDKTKEYATSLSLNSEQFNGCVDTKKYESAVNADFAYYTGKYGSPSTPTTFVLLPKNKTNNDTLRSLSDSYPKNIVLGQDTNNYIVVAIGAIPYDMFKIILDSVSNGV